MSHEQILETALRLFAKEGYSQTSLQRIADECGMGQTALLYHFPSKFQLLERALDFVVSHNRQMVAARLELDDGALVRLRKHFEGNLEWARKYPHESQLILLLYYLGAHRAEFRRLYQGLRANACLRIRELLAAGQREGVVRPRLDLERVASLLHNALVGGFVNYQATGAKDPSIPALGEEWELLFDKLVGV